MDEHEPLSDSERLLYQGSVETILSLDQPKDSSRKRTSDQLSTQKPKKIKQIRRAWSHADPSVEVLPTLEELSDQDGNLPDDLIFELQSTTCISLPATLSHYKCSPCISRPSGYICAFRFIRYWICEKQAISNRIVGGPTIPSQTDQASQLDYQTPKFPVEFNRLPDLEDLLSLRRSLAKILLPAIESELEWSSDPLVKFIGRRIDLVTKCDYCSATLIGAAWLCSRCGAEACTRCFDLLVERGNTPINSDWLKRLKACTKWHRTHTPNEHLKISHITRGELVSLRDQMIILTSTEQQPIQHFPARTTPLEDPPPYSIPADLLRFLYHPEDDSSEPYIKINVHDLEADPRIFDTLWSAGQMIVVTGMNDRLRLHWTPDYFREKYGEDVCERIDSNCPKQVPIITTVSKFFKDFLDHHHHQPSSENHKVWKLRDWPPEADFQNQFPELFADFEQAIPIPDITTRFGIRNVAGHFPTNANVPDIGPKMYIAMKNSDQVGSRGSTVLHMDVADAINIQTYASIEDNEGCALWHLYHAKDSETLRRFLYDYQARELDVSVDEVKNKLDDPIHTTRIYINAEMRKTLREEYGVKGWEVKQKPGEAIFIPAYTAHQVCNLANCIKVAADFVSPHSIERCIKLTEEFRVQNHEHRKPWREDLLQINQMLLYAFLSTGRNPEEFKVQKL
ncbi:hypothetical protein PSTG_14293 [Puccinia striiformis f. sp. tritici PST-78]|uniref:JmjC domain-containing protein n=2 Tax=Puccinia striiformis f. sp. tritici TaxID=168172 RepID=A0A0L0UZ81_9BASI|nr:hypothetical protein PSTG_14293 [Puccinia striiformis f. sp. tritici PST-78]